MSKTPERPDRELSKKTSLSAGIKKLGAKAKGLFVKIGDGIYNAMGATDFGYGYTYSKNGKFGICGLVGAKYEEFILCGDNFIWAFRDDKWRLLDKEGKEIENFGADYVKDITTDYTKGGITEGRIYSIDGNRGMVANNGTIIPANYVDMYQCSPDEEGFEQAFIVGKEKLENGEEKLWAISIEDGSRTEYNPSKIKGEDSLSEDDSEESKLNEVINENLSFRKRLKKVAKETSKNLRDNLYNKILKDKFVLDIDGQKAEFKSYMLNGKVGIEGVLEPEYEELEPCSEKFIWMRAGKKRGLIDLNGNVVIEPKYDYVDKNTYEVGGKQGFINPDGEDLGAKYDFILGNYVVVGKKMGLVDRKNGKEVISPVYDDLRVLSGCLIAKVRLGDKYGLFSTIDGSVIKNVEYDRIKKDRKTKMLLCMKGNNIIDKVNYDISSKKKD